MVKKIALIGIRSMGLEHYRNLLDLVKKNRIILKALCDKHEGALEMPQIKNSVQQLDM